MIVADLDLANLPRVWVEEDSHARCKNKCDEGILCIVPICSDGDVVVSDRWEFDGKEWCFGLGILIVVGGGESVGSGMKGVGG